MRLLIITIILSLLPIQSLAMEVKYHEQGEPAKFSGYLISPETEKQFRLMDKELSFQTQLNISLTKINTSYQTNADIMQQRIVNQQTNIDHLTDQLSKDNSVWGKLGMLLLGVGVGITSAYIATQALK